MKKFLSGFIAGILIASLFSVFAQNAIKKAYFNDNITIKVNGVKQDVQALSVILEGSNNASTYLPLRKTAELLGKDINWDADTNTADIVEKKTASVQPTTQKEEFVDEYGVKGEIIDGIKWVNVRSMIDAFEGKIYSVDYDYDTNTIKAIEIRPTKTKNKSIYLNNVENILLSDGGLGIKYDYYVNYILPLVTR